MTVSFCGITMGKDKFGKIRFNTGQEMSKAIRKEVSNIGQAYTLIRYAHAASHFAPTCKNLESRGHITFVATCHFAGDGAHEINTSYFVMVDCAGGEGETAFFVQHQKY